MNFGWVTRSQEEYAKTQKHHKLIKGNHQVALIASFRHRSYKVSSHLCLGEQANLLIFICVCVKHFKAY